LVAVSLVFSRGRIVQGGTVTVEAEGEFAILDHARVHQMASGRRAAFERAATENPPVAADPAVPVDGT
jgi:hypothetical protein